jgi:uncharacterized protein (DUF302 family)
MAPAGLIILRSPFSPQKTGERLVAAINEYGFQLLARIDHAAAASKVGMELRPTELFVFGNPRGGTPLMQMAQTIGIDLPLKALVGSTRRGTPGSPTITRNG